MCSVEVRCSRIILSFVLLWLEWLRISRVQLNSVNVYFASQQDGRRYPTIDQHQPWWEATSGEFAPRDFGEAARVSSPTAASHTRLCAPSPIICSSVILGKILKKVQGETLILEMTGPTRAPTAASSARPAWLPFCRAAPCGLLRLWAGSEKKLRGCLGICPKISCGGLSQFPKLL